MLNIANLHAAYGKVEVLHGISLNVPKGKVVTLIGSNGAGKTTTMRAISGMIKPKSGSVTLAGQDVTGQPSHKIARAGLAHSPEGRRVFASMSVTDNLLLGAFPRFTRSRPRGDVQGDLERAMELFPRLAPILVEEVFKIIARLKEQGVTMLLVEQFAAAALNVADYGYVLENGRISVHGEAEKLKNDPAVRAAYLGGAH
jgi:branched-chain amino acid transport system ATP-binding protein